MFILKGVIILSLTNNEINFFWLTGTPILGRSMNHLKKETIKALEVRRNTVMAERRKSKMQTLGANGDIYGGGSIYGVTPSVNGRSHRSSNAGINVRDVFSDVPVSTFTFI